MRARRGSVGWRADPARIGGGRGAAGGTRTVAAAWNTTTGVASHTGRMSASASSSVATLSTQPLLSTRPDLRTHGEVTMTSRREHRPAVSLTGDEHCRDASVGWEMFRGPATDLSLPATPAGSSAPTPAGSRRARLPAGISYRCPSMADSGRCPCRRHAVHAHRDQRPNSFAGHELDLASPQPGAIAVGRARTRGS